MKKLLFIFFLFPFTLLAQSVKQLEEVKLSNGKTIIIYDNKTWEYKGTAKNNNNSTKDISGNTNIKSSNTKNNNSNTYTTSSTCGARTKSGGYCKRKVSGGGRCWQHK